MSADTDWDEIQAAIAAWVMAGSGLSVGQVVWGRQVSGTPDVPAPRPPAPAIVMQFGSVGDIGLPWVDQVENPFAFSPVSVTGVSGSTLQIGASGVFNIGDGPVQFASTATLPPPLVANTDYWLIAIDGTHVQVAGSFANTGGTGGAAGPATPITLTGAGSGTITMVESPNGSWHAGQEFKNLARGLTNAVLELRCHADTGFGLNMAEAILGRVKRRRVWPSQRAILQAVGLAVYGAERVRTLAGIRDAVLFEPKAILSLYLCLADEEADTQPTTEIDTVQIQEQVQEPGNGPTVGKNFTVTNQES